MEKHGHGQTDPKVSPIQKKLGPTQILPEPGNALIPPPRGIDEGETPDQDKAPPPLYSGGKG